MTDRQFTHPNVGHTVRVEICGNEVRLIFVCEDGRGANAVGDSILSQLKQGAINITLMGKPTSVTED